MSERFVLNCVAHAPTPSSDTSTTEGCPVWLRANNAAATPPAMVIPPSESPYAPVGMPMNASEPGGVTASPLPPRAQYAVLS